MSNKDHSLDKKIIKAAEAEFIEYGYKDASINRIVKKAGVTTGAIYTRYKNKNDLFSGLFIKLRENFWKGMKGLEDQYNALNENSSVETFLDVCSAEKDFLLDVIFRNYEKCQLLLCKSSGSEAAEHLKAMIDVKVEGTVQFMERISGGNVESEAIGLIISANMNMFKEILERGFDKEKACSCLEAVFRYQRPAWELIFREAAGKK